MLFINEWCLREYNEKDQVICQWGSFINGVIVSEIPGKKFAYEVILSKGYVIK